MNLAILITNTDFSDFATARPDDGEKFAALIAEVRPDWHYTPFRVCKGVFPEDVAAYDGLIVTGSPASVTEDAPWMLRLAAVLRAALDRRQPVFGACFGHQLIARALGAGIVRNPEGWGHGLLEVTRTGRTPWAVEGEVLHLYGSHIEQVAEAPEGARVVFEGPGLPVAGLAQGNHLFTIQHHPEMTHGFITDLVEEYAEVVGPEVTARARTSLARRADRVAFAEEIARFFETGTGEAR
ncbi:type 1 glutamine amidotransferase [Sagittula sp. S175]|uniref:type 1 glutamine amidotransferase n=1 Tax=Sagittula sp. S175 TaxID=3415129 RepID=UPI003C7EB20B